MISEAIAKSNAVSDLSQIMAQYDNSNQLGWNLDVNSEIERKLSLFSQVKSHKISSYG